MEWNKRKAEVVKGILMSLDNWPVVGAIMAAVVGIYGWLILHIRDHPTKKDIDDIRSNVRWEKTCDERSKSISDCIEREIVERREAYKELKEDMKSGFNEIKGLLHQRNIDGT